MSTESIPEDWPDDLDEIPKWARTGVRCGWCDEKTVYGITWLDRRIKLLWHQWRNHRQRIWEEY